MAERWRRMSTEQRERDEDRESARRRRGKREHEQEEEKTRTAERKQTRSKNSLLSSTIKIVSALDQKRVAGSMRLEFSVECPHSEGELDSESERVTSKENQFSASAMMP